MKLGERVRAVSPHGQVWVLFAVAIVVVAALSGATFLALGPPQSRIDSLETRLIPAIAQLDRASTSYTKTGVTLHDVAVETDPIARDRAVASRTVSNSAGQVAWKAFKHLSVGFPGEAALQHRFELQRAGALVAGGQVVTGSADGDATLRTVTRLTAALLADLGDVKALYEKNASAARRDAHQSLGDTQRDLGIFAALAIVGLAVVFGLAARAARDRERKVEVLDRRLANDSTRNELEARLQRAFELVQSEEASYVVINRSLASAARGMAAELLLADSSRAHFRQATKTAELGDDGCAVMSPAECPAASRGQTQVWVSSNDIDACPHLQDRVGGACSAVCVPMSVAGNTVGVFHATAEDGNPPETGTIVSVELLSRKAGERIGMLRAFTKAEVQALTDPLTGLMNRRGLEVQVHSLTEATRGYVVAYGDLDHFKQLNDVYGHDAGDRALRLFTCVVRDSVRPTDIPARYGGEEFVIVLPDCSVPDAVRVINRLRERLASAQHGATVPPFTVSFGVASAPAGAPFDDTVELADAGLLDAKAQGRDRVVVAGAEHHDPDEGEGRSTSEPRLVA